MKHIYQIKIVTLLVFAIGLLTNNSVAQNVQLNASVNKNKISIDDHFEYKIEIFGQSTSLPDPKFPSFEGFTVLSGPNTSTNIQFVNGRMSSSKSYSFYLQPQKLGTINIPPAKVEIDDEVISSNEITMEAVKGAVKESKQNQATVSTNDADLLGENLYLKAEVDKKNVYQNEQIIVTYKLYFRVQVRSYNLEKAPSFPDFWKEEFQLPSQPPINTEIVNGIQFQVASLSKVALFPTRTGELTLDPLAISVDAIVKTKRKSRSIFDDFFDDPFGRTVRTTLTTKQVTVNVKPLPKQGQPNDFTGIVGKYTFGVISDKNELKVNEASSIKVMITGEGNIKLLKPPALGLPPDMEVYDPKEQTNIKKDNNKITGSKIVEYVVVPRFAGDYTIKQVTFTYFDPSARQYKVLQSKPINFKVLPGESTGGSLVSVSNLSKQEVALLGEDIRYIKESMSFYRTGQKIYFNWLYLGAYFIPLIGLVIALFYRKQMELVRTDQQLAQRRKAGKIALKHLSEAKRALRPDHGGEFYKKTSKALQGFVSDRLNIQMTDFNNQTVRRNLDKVGVGADEIMEYQGCLDESDFKQFAGSDADIEEMKTFYERAKSILTLLEKYI